MYSAVQSQKCVLYFQVKALTAIEHRTALDPNIIICRAWVYNNYFIFVMLVEHVL